jgi:hypothetical protein
MNKNLLSLDDILNDLGTDVDSIKNKLPKIATENTESNNSDVETMSDDELKTLIKEAFFTPNNAKNIAKYTLTQNEMLKIASISTVIGEKEEEDIDVHLDKLASQEALIFMQKLANPMMDQIQGQMDPAMQGQMDPAMQGQMDPAMQGQMDPAMQGPVHPAMAAAQQAPEIISDALINGLPKEDIIKVIDAAREIGFKEGVQMIEQLMVDQQIQGQMDPAMQGQMDPAMQGQMDPAMQGQMDPAMTQQVQSQLQ